MDQIVGGYRFGRQSSFDFHGGVPSYAWVVADDEGFILPVNQEFGLTDTEVLVAKVRVLSGRINTYLQVYSVQTGEKLREVLNSSKAERVLADFNKLF